MLSFSNHAITMNNQESTSIRPGLYVFISILAVASLAYRLTQGSEFSSSSILFVGIPTLISLLVVKFGSTPKTTMGMIFRAITLFLLISSIFLGEGIACILLAAPIFYFVGFVIAVIADYTAKKGKGKTLSFLLAPLIIILAQPLDINKPTFASVSNSVTFDHDISIDQLTYNPDLNADLPSFFKMGFPTPQSIEGSGVNIGDQRNIEFLSSTKGVGTLTLEVSKVSEQVIHFDIVHDNTHIGRWLNWEHIQVEIQKEDNQSTVTWTSDFSCTLGPQWYFVPIERYAVGLMNKHLIESYFDR